MGFFLGLIISLVLMVVAYLIMPKQKQSSPEIADMDDPTAEAGRPIPVLFGTKTIKGLNVLWYGEKRYVTKKIKA
ncbi:hypothetical protein G3A39_39345 [Paraburkholderia aspalathi]|nr:hypothetical protein [Paraburkholderia aspalathi]